MVVLLKRENQTTLFSIDNIEIELIRHDHLSGQIGQEVWKNFCQVFQPCQKYPDLVNLKTLTLANGQLPDVTKELMAKTLGSARMDFGVEEDKTTNQRSCC